MFLVSSVKMFIYLLISLFLVITVIAPLKWGKGKTWTIKTKLKKNELEFQLPLSSRKDNFTLSVSELFIWL